MRLTLVYQMKVAISSPSCANFALRQVVADNNAHDSDAADAILNNFYVDDMLKSDDAGDCGRETWA